MGTTSERARGNTNRCRPHHDKAVIERARRLWDTFGLTATRIGRIVGLSRVAICAIARRNGFAERASLTAAQERVPIARELWVQRVPIAEMASRLNIKPAAVYGIARRYHFPSRGHVRG